MNTSLEVAKSAYEAGDVEDAMRHAKQYLCKHKDDARAWELIGLIQYSRGRFAVSVSALERASLLVPLRPAAQVCLAHGYAHIGKVELSRDLLVSLFPNRAFSTRLMLQVATGLDSIDRPDLAVRACRIAVERNPEDAQPYYDLGYYAARCGQPTHVTESLARTALSLAPENVSFRIGLASLLMKQDRKHEAYHLISVLTNDQIAKISCFNCLNRVTGLFESSGDHRRTVLCRQRLLELELLSDESTCE